MSLDWETAIRAIPLVAGAVFSLYRLRDLEPRLRSKLKADLEILSQLDPESSAHALLKSNIEAGVEKLYAKPRSNPKWTDVAAGVVFIVVFGFWTVYLVRDGFTWWALLTGYLTFAGIGLIAIGFRFEPQKDPNDSNGSNKGIRGLLSRRATNRKGGTANAD